MWLGNVSHEVEETLYEPLPAGLVSGLQFSEYEVIGPFLVACV